MRFFSWFWLPKAARKKYLVQKNISEKNMSRKTSETLLVLLLIIRCPEIRCKIRKVKKYNLHYFENLHIRFPPARSVRPFIGSWGTKIRSACALRKFWNKSCIGRKVGKQRNWMVDINSEFTFFTTSTSIHGCKIWVDVNFGMTDKEFVSRDFNEFVT